MMTHKVGICRSFSNCTPSACKDSNGRIINPGDQVWAQGRRHFVDTVNRVTNQVSCGMNQFDCKDVEVMPR